MKKGLAQDVTRRTSHIRHQYPPSQKRRSYSNTVNIDNIPDAAKIPKDLPKIVFHAPPKDPKEVSATSDNVKKIMELIKNLNFIEIIALAKELSRLTGISEESMANMATGNMGLHPGPVAQGQAAPTGAQGEAPAEAGKAPAKPAPPEKKAVKSASVKLVSMPEGAKFSVLRELRKLKPGMNLMDSKKLVENLPQILQKDVPPDEQKEWKDALEGAGAKIEFI